MQINASHNPVPGARVVLAAILTIALMLSVTSWTLAEESVPADSPQEPTATTVVDNPAPPVNPEPEQPVAPAPAPTQEPAAPEPEPPVKSDAPVVPAPDTEPEPPVIPDAPVVPAPDPEPEPPAPDAPIIPVPVEPVPIETEALATEEPLPTETPAPTVTQSPTPEPTATPSPTPSPTPEPTPVINWSQTEQVSCALRDGHAAGLKYAESRTYRCNVAANVASDIDMPDDMDIEWTVDVNFPDSYTLQFPQGSQASVKQQLPGASATKYTITHPWQQGSVQKLTFDLVVNRTTCAIGERVLSVQASPEIDTRASEAEINRSGGTPNRATVSTNFLPNLEAPDVSMTPVDFGTLEWNGESWGTATGTSTITVTNNQPCATSQDHNIELQINASDPGMMPMLVSVETEQSGFTAIEGDRGVALIPAGFSGSTTLNVGFELTPPDDVFEGDYTFGFEGTVTAVP